MSDVNTNGGGGGCLTVEDNGEIIHTIKLKKDECGCIRLITGNIEQVIPYRSGDDVALRFEMLRA